MPSATIAPLLLWSGEATGISHCAAAANRHDGVIESCSFGSSGNGPRSLVRQMFETDVDPAPRLQLESAALPWP